MDKAFSEIAHGLGSNYGYKDLALGTHGYGFKQFHSRQDALMGVRRRQLLDPNDPMQLQQHYIALINNVIADVDSGKVFAFDTRYQHRVPLIYSSLEITQLQYPPEEQKMLSSDLQILKGGTGVSASYIKSAKLDYHILDKITQGTITQQEEIYYFGQPLAKNVQGFYFDGNRIEQLAQHMDDTAERDDRVRRAIKWGADTMGPNIKAMTQGLINDPSIQQTHA